MLKNLPTNWKKSKLGQKLSPHYDEAIFKINENLNSCLKHGILINETDPTKYVAIFLASIELSVPSFLCNPKWKVKEWEQVLSLITPALVFGEQINLNNQKNKTDLHQFQNFFMIPTGGSSGTIKFAIHNWENLTCSALSTKLFLKQPMINSLCDLPVYHISGLMQYIRALTTGGNVIQQEAKNTSRLKKLPILNEVFFISLVPTQLDRILKNKDFLHWLKQFKGIFIGGSSTSENILIKASKENLPLILTYGMTETASMITALPSDEFIQGKSGTGKPLSHSKINLDSQRNIHIQADSLFYGYYPETPKKKTSWTPNDEAYIDINSNLHITGRTDRIIITGGEKVDPLEIETTALKIDSLEAISVSSIEDIEWGAKIIAFYTTTNKSLTAASIKSFLKEYISEYKIPKEWILVDRLPLTKLGKKDRKKEKELWHEYKSR